ncbi:uncharacterized protein LOC107811293 [Nicotiana tabacum]|uniref:Uncharacterized protein LOC107811293 n=1 Tax=Nicotiana tabacum TaxID=4097 RepID=A0AC58TX46_TOBAC
MTIQSQLQQNYNEIMHQQERSALWKLEKWSMVEERIMKQKARAKWIQLGDANTKYFSVVMKDRNHRKQIKELTTLEGRKINQLGEIKEEAIRFYKSLMGTTERNLPVVNRMVMKKGPTLSQEQRQLLCAEVTKQKVHEGLKGIEEDKAPGIDGYNVVFYKTNYGTLLAEFIPGRKIGDNIIMAHELIKGYTRKHMTPRSWVMECVKTINYTIMVNGEQTDLFNAEKGLRQGDHVSPFLFAIAMEYLSRILKKMTEKQQFHYHPRCAKLEITHLCFADDLLIFSRGDISSVTEILNSFN